MSSDGHGCLVCSGGSAWLGPLLCFVVLGLLAAIFLRNKQRIKDWVSRNKSWLASFGDKLISFLITTQIIVMLKINHER